MSENLYFSSILPILFFGTIYDFIQFMDNPVLLWNVLLGHKKAPHLQGSSS